MTYQPLLQPSLIRSKVLDLVPFGSAGSHAGLYALRLDLPNWGEWHPGQFVMLRPKQNIGDAPWGRAFTICRYAKDSLVIFFQVKGRVTRQMTLLKPEDEVDVWGPLGNALAMEPKNETLILAGGMGIAPFVSYIQEHPAPWNISMLFGHTLSLNYYPYDSLTEKIIAHAFHDTKPGDTEKFSQLIEERIAKHAEKTQRKGLILSCGPTPFLKKTQELSVHYKIRTQISLETRMACGIGACLGCVVKMLPDGNTVKFPRYAQTCTCGPNFWADSIILEGQ